MNNLIVGVKLLIYLYLFKVSLPSSIKNEQNLIVPFNFIFHINMTTDIG